MASKQKITTFLWFDGNAEEAVNHYTSIFKNSKILDVARYGDAGPGPKGSVMTVTFELEGQEFIALNGGPQFKFTEAISLLVNCDTQKEVDELQQVIKEVDEFKRRRDELTRKVKIITVYEPDPAEWIDLRTRRPQ